MSASNEAERHSLLQGLHDAVKQCQIRYGGRTELATEKDSRVQCLLIQLERFFQHGIRRNKIREAINSMSEPFRQVTSKMLPILVEGEANFWPFVREHLSQLEVERYLALRGINTDAGRARAWLRSSLNEHSLERYLVNFLQNEFIYKQYYEDWALMQDVEKATAITMLAKGLAPIYFAISLDNPELNGPFRTNQHFTDPAYLKPRPQEKAPIVSGSGAAPIEAVQQRRRKKVKEAAISDMLFPDEDEAPSANEQHRDDGVKSEENQDIHERIRTVSSKIEGNQHINPSEVDQTSSPNVDDAHKTYPIENRLAHLSTSFKSTFTSLSFDRHNSYPGCNIVPKLSTSTEQGTSQIPSMQYEHTHSEPAADTVQDLPSSFVDTSGSFRLSETSTLSHSGVFDMSDLSSSPTGVPRSRYTSAMLDEVLGTGELLSASDGFAHCNLQELKLKTPPPTPSTPSVSLASSSVDPKRKLRSSLDHDAAAYVRVCLLKEMGGDNDDDAKQMEEVEGGRTEEARSHRTRTQSFDVSSGGDDVSIASSAAESLCNDLDIMKPLGTDDRLFNGGVMSYDRESSKAAVAALAVLNASSTAMQSTPSQRRETPKDSMTTDYSQAFTDTMESDDGNLNIVDLKQAILLTAKRKEEVEEHNRVLKSALDEERERCANLQSEFSACEVAKQDTDSKNNEKINELLRENDVLKNQLKKYVAAVQMLRRDCQGQSTSDAGDVLNSLRGFPDGSEPLLLSPRPAERSNSENDSIYEEKLGQMAELHGELLEFNEMLQKQLINRDATLTKLREELVNLRGPLPVDCIEEVEDNRRDSFSLSRPLINIWVPSVFMKGKGSDSYHLYQIYIRIRDEEWNIYRRYSQFYKLHTKAVKRYSSLEKFSFPPKKLIGKNDLSFVEKRRKRLQDYLRLLINACLSDNRQLADSPNKENLAGFIPFFCDPYIEDAVTKKKKTQPTQKMGSSNPRYTGL